MVERARLAGYRVLVADDDPDFVDYLEGELRRLGAVSVVVADSGLEALEALALGGPFDLVLTDHRMPAPSGAQLLAMARTAGYRTPFLIVTGYPGDELVESVAVLEGVGVIGKPFDIGDLAGAASALIGRSDP
jgi:CheY-like chemotaxis protein